MSKDKTEYQREYYSKNKDRIKTQRKTRYQKDEEYRNAFNLKRRMSRHKKQLIDIYDSLDLAPVEDNVLHDCVMKVLSTDQTQSCICKMYTMKGIALEVRVDKVKLVHWVYLERLPNANYRNGSNWRLYTEYEVQILKRAFAHFRKKANLENRKFTLTKEMSAYCFARFEELIGGIPEDQFTEEG